MFLRFAAVIVLTLLRRRSPATLYGLMKRPGTRSARRERSRDPPKAESGPCEKAILPNEATDKMLSRCQKKTYEKLPGRTKPPKANDWLCGFVAHSPFSIPHSAFSKCHTMTLIEKNVLAKRTHLKPMPEKGKWK